MVESVTAAMTLVLEAFLQQFKQTVASSVRETSSNIAEQEAAFKCTSLHQRIQLPRPRPPQPPQLQLPPSSRQLVVPLLRPLVLPLFRQHLVTAFKVAIPKLQLVVLLRARL